MQYIVIANNTEWRSKWNSKVLLRVYWNWLSSTFKIKFNLLFDMLKKSSYLFQIFSTLTPQALYLIFPSNLAICILDTQMVKLKVFKLEFMKCSFTFICRYGPRNLPQQWSQYLNLPPKKHSQKVPNIHVFRICPNKA